MSYQEKQNIVNIGSGLLITAIYAFMIWKRQLAGNFDLKEDFDTW